MVPVEQVDIKGETKIYKDTTPDSGNTTQRFFCPSCGSPVQTVGPSRPGLTVIKCGLFAKAPQSQLKAPAAELFCRNTKSWESHVEGSKRLQALTQ